MDLGDLVEQTGLARGVWGWRSAPKFQGRTLPPRARWFIPWRERVGLLITTLIREKTKQQGLNIF